MKIMILTLAVAWAPSGVARAQDAEGSRAAEAEQLRTDKAAQLEPPVRGRFERALLVFEQRYLAERYLNPPRGLYLRFGGMPEGQGFTAGPAYRYSTPAASFTVTSAVSIRRAWEVTGRLDLPRPTLAPASRFLSIGALYHHLPEENFYGFGQSSLPIERSNFRLDQSSVDVTGGLSPSAWFTVSGTAAYLTERPGPGTSPALPSIEALHRGLGAPAFPSDLDFVRLGGEASINLASAPQQALTGGRYLFSAHRYRDQTEDRYSFNRWDVDLQQYIPIFTPARLIALRAHVAGVEPDDGQEVPFYLQPTLGGSHSLRGYPHQRFRDRNTLLLQAEYRFMLNEFMTGSLFYDAGKVAFDRHDLWDWDDLRDDYGFSLRFGFGAVVALRAEIAFGGSEGRVYAVRFSDVF